MKEIMFEIFIFFLGIIVVWISCNIACEYRNYGHRFIKAFRASTNFQDLFTVLQRKDIDEWDMNKLTYIGYFATIICTFSAIFVIPFVIFNYFFNLKIAINTYLLWVGGCFILCLIAFFTQMIDSLLNFILEIFNK